MIATTGGNAAVAVGHVVLTEVASAVKPKLW